ncbi:MAG TPA: hypothetical protein VOA87_05030, partial [Thermoanaerobaculia bacterium]|nr:hypothetical protein [Thermoanaerobaculia bacterium]
MTEPDDDDHAYFRAIEEVFVRLRGSPLLLSPADWQVARRWHREGVPLDLVGNALEEVFARRRERGAKGKISSLRYCAPAVEAAWSHLRELTAPGERAEVAALDVPSRLAALAAALPAELPERDELVARLAALAAAAGGTEAVERRLAEIDRELLDGADRRASARLAEEV